MEKIIIFFFIIVASLIQLSVAAQTQYSIYYLSIGSAHYKKNFTDEKASFLGLANVPAARVSAIKMSNLFDSLGAVKGKVILSESGKYITKKQILDQMKQLILEVKTSKAKNPFIFFYYCGHGFSNGVLEAQFIPPGTFIKNPGSLSYEELEEEALAPLDIREILDASKIHYMMLLDCCYEGNQKHPERMNKETINALGLKQLDALMGQTFQILVSMNRMIGPDPVFFSTKAGNSVPTVSYSFNNVIEYVGPLCRKSYLILGEKLKKEKNISVADLAIMLKSKELDSVTGPGISYWVFDEQNTNYLIVK